MCELLARFETDTAAGEVTYVTRNHDVFGDQRSVHRRAVRRPEVGQHKRCTTLADHRMATAEVSLVDQTEYLALRPIVVG